MHRRVVLTVLLAVLIGCGPPVRVTHFREFAKTDADVPRVDWQAYAANYADHDAVILEFDAKAEHHIHLGPMSGELINWDYYENRILRYVLLDPESEDYARFSQRLPAGREATHIQLRVVSPSGHVDHYDMTQIKRKRDEHGRTTYKFIYPKLEKGSVIEERMEVKESNPGLGTELPVQFSVPCELVRVRFAFPHNWQHALKSTAKGTKPEVVRTLSADGKMALVDYRATDVEPIYDEPFSPPFKVMAQYLEFDFSNIQGQSVYENWFKLADQYRNRFVMNDSTFSRRVQKITQTVIADLKTPDEKAHAIVNWVQTNIALSKTPTYRNFAQILKDGQADPMMMTGLTVKMMNEAGISSEMAMIHSADDGYFDRSFVSPGQLYIPSCMTFEKGLPKSVFFPFVPYLPIGHIPSSFQGQSALAFGELRPTHFVKVPYLDDGSGLVEEHFQVEVEPNGRLNVVEQKVIYGANAFALRQWMDDMDQTELDELIDDLVTYEGGEVVLTRKEILGREAVDEPIRFELAYQIDNLVTVTPDEVLFATAGLFSPISKTKIKVMPDSRHNPIQIVDPQHYRKHIEIKYSADWSLDTVFEPSTVVNSFGQLQTQYHYLPGQFKTTLDLKLNRVDAPVESFGTLVKLIGSEDLRGFSHLVFATNAED